MQKNTYFNNINTSGLATIYSAMFYQINSHQHGTRRFRKKTVQISKPIILQVRKENSGFLYYKNSFVDEHFKLIDLRRDLNVLLIKHDFYLRIRT